MWGFISRKCSCGDCQITGAVVGVWLLERQRHFGPPLVSITRLTFNMLQSKNNWLRSRNWLLRCRMVCGNKYGFNISCTLPHYSEASFGHGVTWASRVDGLTQCSSSLSFPDSNTIIWSSCMSKALVIAQLIVHCGVFLD